MPELPEVETIRRDLETRIVNCAITDVRVLDERVIRNCSGRQFAKFCKGKTVQSVSRRGKAILIQLNPASYLVVQPMMTGQLIYCLDQPRIVDRATKIVFKLSNGASLNYNDQRLFGRVNGVHDLDEIPFLKTIGVEPFDQAFTAQKLKELFHHRPGPIKSLLMNQQLVAGIGNIYASEILFRSQISPTRTARALKFSEIEALRKATIDILKDAVKFRGTSMRNYRDTAGEKGKFMNRIKVYGRGNEECYVCRAPIVKIVQAGRSTFYCKKCQR